MKRYLLAVFLFGVLILTAVVFCLSDKNNFSKHISTIKFKDDSAIKPAVPDYGKLPLIFEENQGQTDEQVKFFSRGSVYTIFLTEAEAVMTLQVGGASQTPESNHPNKHIAEPSVLRIKTLGSNSPSKIEGQSEQITKSNYFIGEDPQKWLRDVPNYQKVLYSDIYSGVDLVYYGNGSQLEYDFIVRPNADPKQISVNFEGAKKLEISREGDLLLQLESGLVRQHKPIIYQETEGERREIAGNYILKNETEIGFEIGEYDDSQPLVIDPILAYATYLGSREPEFPNGIAVDAVGNAYITGYAVPPYFPTTPGSVHPTTNNKDRLLLPFVAKFNSTGTALLYSTYLGGAGEGIAVDAEGNAYTTGYPHPERFSTTPGALDMGRGGIGVTKLNPQGNQIIYAARFGSSGTDSAREIAVDAQGNAVVIGSAGCYTSCDFPILNAAQSTPPTPNGGGGFVAKLNAAGSALVYSTYLGGGAEELWGVDVDPAGNAYVTGNTSSSRFPTTPGAFDRTFACPDPPFCNPDSFVTKIPAAGGAFAYSTYLGGRGSERGWSIAVDDAGNAYAAGETSGRFSGAPDEGFPTTPGAFKMFGSIDAYVTKLNPTGSALVYSTLLGGVDGTNCFDERARDIDVDRLGQAYVVGLVDCNTFPVVDAIQPAPASFREEAFLTKFNSTGTALVYSTYLGGPRYDEAYGVAVDRASAAYVTGTTSGDFQLITPGAYDPTWNCPNGDCEHPDDIFVLKVNGMAHTLAKPADFDGDGKSDISIFRPSVGEWWYLRSLDGGNYAAQFGASSDKLVPGDFTGDGRTDIAIFRPSSGEWFILRSEDGSYYSFPFGTAGDIPAPGDFDGDGRADASVFRPSDSTWYVNKSSGGTTIQQFGTSGDVPVVSDYDGDAKADIAIFRPSLGEWWIQRSSLGTIVFQFGNRSDKPVQGDYTGDGKADVAIWRSSTGEWFILRSENQSYYSFPFGISGDVPAPGDFDGDGKFDATVFRPADATWYVQRSTAGMLIRSFGQNGDSPIPNAFVP